MCIRDSNFYRVETDVDGMNFVTARGWEDLSSLLKVYELSLIHILAGVLPPTTTALLHNGSTILISVNSMKNLLE